MKVKRLTETAKLPTKANPGDSCFDLYSDESVQTRFGEITEIKTGIAIEFPVGIGGVIKPRSGLSRDHGLIILGGEIDSGYRGEIIVLMLARFFNLCLATYANDLLLSLASFNIS